MPDDNGEAKAATPPARGLARGRVKRKRKRSSQPPAPHVVNAPANAGNSSDEASRGSIAAQRGKTEDARIAEPDQELLDAIKAVPAEWDRKLLKQLASLLAPGPRALHVLGRKEPLRVRSVAPQDLSWWGRQAPLDSGFLQKAVTDIGWWAIPADLRTPKSCEANLLTALRLFIEDRMLICDPGANGPVPPEYAGAVRDVLYDVATVGVVAALLAANAKQREAAVARNNSANTARKEKTAALHAEVRAAFANYRPGYPKKEVYFQLSVKFGLRPNTIRDIVRGLRYCAGKMR